MKKKWVGAYWKIGWGKHSFQAGKSPDSERSGAALGCAAQKQRGDGSAV